MDSKDLNERISEIKTALKYPELFENISPAEQLVSGVFGSYLLIKSAKKIITHPLLSLIGMGVGAGLLYRGLTGYCPVKDALKKKNRDVIITETYFRD